MYYLQCDVYHYNSESTEPYYCDFSLKMRYLQKTEITAERYLCYRNFLDLLTVTAQN